MIEFFFIVHSYINFAATTVCVPSQTRCACLPRQQVSLDPCRFTFFNSKPNSFPAFHSTTFSADLTQETGMLTMQNMFNHKRIPKNYPKQTQEDECGLCGKTKQEMYLANAKTLFRTDYCFNWVCDDTHMFSVFLRLCFNHKHCTSCD